MSKQRKLKSNPSDSQAPSVTHSRKILPHKLSFIAYKSGYDYGTEFRTQPYRVKNPKWCHLDLDLGQTESAKDCAGLGKVKSLRLRSLHLASYHLDSQFIADAIHPYFGELDCLTRAGRALKRLSLSITFNSKAEPELVEQMAEDKLLEKYEDIEDIEEYSKGPYSRLRKFVKDQKYLDEFRLYTGSSGDSDWAAQMLIYMEKTLKILTLQNLSVKDLFSIYMFPKLEVLRFEHVLIDQYEGFFDYSLLVDALDDILALPSLKTMIFSQYQHYNLASYYYDDDEECDVEKMPKIESDSEFAGIKQLPMKFWEILREKLDKNKDKPLRVLYHMQDDCDPEKARKEKEEADKEMEIELEGSDESEESEDNEDKENKGDKKNKSTNPKKAQYKRLKNKKNDSVILKKMNEFKKIFDGLTLGQTFEYEVRIPSLENQKLPGIRLIMPQGVIEEKLFPGDYGRVPHIGPGI